MTGRTIINRKEIDQFIVERVRGCPPELALMALRKPFLNEPELYVPMTAMPKDPPWWLTKEAVEQGNVVVFDARQLKVSLTLATKWMLLKDWLEVSPLHLREEATREARKWMNRLRHIKTLDEALGVAVRDMAQWKGKASPSDGAPEFSRPNFTTELEERGEIVRVTPVPDGRIWFELFSERAILHEGIVMENCLSGQERHNYLGTRARLFSLRGDDSADQVTLGISPFARWTAKRRRNDPIRDADMEAIQILLDFIGYEDPMKALLKRVEKLRRRL
ncbi:hypothetical protein [Hyphomicrobium sp.]|uniref:hypothetical protein n=1 Tax=Hyphomicrobium sp. TaxID=82 RepID=UPI002FE26136